MRRGRITTQDKLDRADRIEVVLPEGFQLGECRLAHHRPVWRIEDGRAVLVAYEIDRDPQRQRGTVPGPLPQCEFGLEIPITLAHSDAGHRRVDRQGAGSTAVLLGVEAVEVSGGLAAQSSGPRVARRVRSALLTAVGVGGGSHGRDLVEHRFGLDVSVGAGAATDLRLSEGCGQVGGALAKSDVRRRVRQRRVRELEQRLRNLCWNCRPDHHAGARRAPSNTPSSNAVEKDYFNQAAELVRLLGTVTNCSRSSPCPASSARTTSASKPCATPLKIGGRTRPVAVSVSVSAVPAAARFWRACWNRCECGCRNSICDPF